MCTCVHASVCASLWHSQQQKEKPLTVLLYDNTNMPEHPSPLVSVLLSVHCHRDCRGYQGRGAQDIHRFLHTVPEHSFTPLSKSTLPWYNCHGWRGIKTKTIIYHCHGWWGIKTKTISIYGWWGIKTKSIYLSSPKYIIQWTEKYASVRKTLSGYEQRLYISISLYIISIHTLRNRLF